MHHNCSEIQASADPDMLNMGTIKKWGEEVGNTLMKPTHEKEATQLEKEETDEELRYKEIFENHSTFKDYGPLRKINKSIPVSDP